MDSRFTLFDKWQIRGHWWWLEDTVENERQIANRLGGELSFEGTGTGITLGLLGDFIGSDDWRHSADDDHNPAIDVGGIPAEVVQAAQQENDTQIPAAAVGNDNVVAEEEVPQERSMWIHGRSVCGKPITLIDAVDSGSTSNTRSPLAAESTIRPRMALLNGHVIPETQYRQLALSFPALTNFFQTEPMFDWQEDQNAHVINIPKPPKEFQVDVTFKETQLSLEIWQRAQIASDSRSEFQISTRTGITLISEEDRPLDWWIELCYSVQYLMSALYGFPTCPDRIFLQSKVGDEAPQYSIWYNFDRSGLKSDAKLQELAVSFETFDVTTIEAAVRNWFNAPAGFEPVAHQFFGNFYFPHNKARVDFVFYSQTLEIFHGFLQPTTSLLTQPQQDLFKALKKLIRKYITKRDNALGTEIVNRLAYTGNPSQRTRLRELFLELEQYVPGVFYQNPDDFVRCIVDTRNSYIHGGTPDFDTLLNIIEQTAAVEGLKLAILALFLRFLGFPADKSVLLALQRCKEFGAWHHLSNQYLDTDTLRQKCTTRIRR